MLSALVDFALTYLMHVPRVLEILQTLEIVYVFRDAIFCTKAVVAIQALPVFTLLNRLHHCMETFRMLTYGESVTLASI